MNHLSIISSVAQAFELHSIKHFPDFTSGSSFKRLYTVPLSLALNIIRGGNLSPSAKILRITEHVIFLDLES